MVLYLGSRDPFSLWQIMRSGFFCLLSSVRAVRALEFVKTKIFLYLSRSPSKLAVDDKLLGSSRQSIANRPLRVDLYGKEEREFFHSNE